MKIYFIFIISTFFAYVSCAEQVYKFDFGPEDSPVFNGFVGVSKNTLYTVEKGYGWSNPADAEEREDFDRQNYDDLCRDLVAVKSSKFKVDVPNGEYIVTVWLGDLQDLMDYLRFGIKAENKVYFKLGAVDFNTYCKLYFKSSNRFYKKTDNPWDTWINPRFLIKSFKVDVYDNQMNIVFSNCRLCAMMIHPAEAESEHQRQISLIEAQRKKQFEDNWQYVENAPLQKALKISDVNQQEYIIFNCHWMDDIYPKTVPARENSISDLNVVCARGEYEPVSFCIYPLENLPHLRVMVDNLFDNKGGKFDTRNIDVRVQDYRLSRNAHSRTYSVKPAQIVQFYDIDIEKGVTRKFWLDVYVPLDTKPGIYKGYVCIAPENKPVRKVVLKLNVLPFELLTDKKKHNYFLQYSIPEQYRNFPKEEKYWQDLKKNYQFMSRFGISGPTLGFDLNTWPLLKWSPAERRLSSINLSQIEKAIKVYSAVPGFSWPRLIYCTYHLTEHGFYEIPQQLNAQNVPQSQQKPEFWQTYKGIITAIKQKQISENWPGFIFLMTSEMSNYYMDFIKYGKNVLINLKIDPDIKLAEMANSFNEFYTLAPLSDIIGMHVSLCTDDVIKYKEKNLRDKQFWLYQSGNRFTYGFYFDRIGADGSFKEDFQMVSADPYNGFDGLWDELCGVQYTLPSPDSPVPLQECYNYREGIDDAKYLYTLREYIKKAETLNSNEAAAQIAEAKKLLEDIMNRTNPDLTYYYGEVGFWDNPAYDKLRKRVSDEIVKLYSIVNPSLN